MTWVTTAFTWSFRSNMQFFCLFCDFTCSPCIVLRVSNQGSTCSSCKIFNRSDLCLDGSITWAIIPCVKNLYIKHWLVVLCLQIMLKVVNHQSFMCHYRGAWTRQDAIELPMEIPLFLRNPNMWKMNKETDSIGTQ